MAGALCAWRYTLSVKRSSRAVAPGREAHASCCPRLDMKRKPANCAQCKRAPGRAPAATKAASKQASAHVQESGGRAALRARTPAREQNPSCSGGAAMHKSEKRAWANPGGGAPCCAVQQREGGSAGAGRWPDLTSRTGRSGRHTAAPQPCRGSRSRSRGAGAGQASWRMQSPPQHAQKANAPPAGGRRRPPAPTRRGPRPDHSRPLLRRARWASRRGAPTA